MTPRTMQAMPNRLTVEEIVPLVEALAPRERTRLLRLITKLPSDDSAIYALNPPAREEFIVKEDPLAWDSEGWENIPWTGAKSAGRRFAIPTSAAPF